MIVKIGKYTKYFGCYQFGELLCFWSKKTKDEFGVKRHQDWVYDFCEWLAVDSKGNQSNLDKFFVWINSKIKRTVKVKIHDYDTWNTDDTLTIIILPLLKRFKELSVNSYGTVDEDDAPTELKGNENSEKRWTWVLDELIWTFEQIYPGHDWESKYFLDNYDKTGHDAHADRIKNGLILFGKYYQHLWD